MRAERIAVPTGTAPAEGWLAEPAAADLELAHLAAIVSSSDGISKTLEGRITSWNAAASRIFGYEAAEMLGESITRIIPPELHDEEEQILGRLRRRERIDHYETVRITKDGRRVDVSLTVSPIRDRFGTIIGASKVARDITERKQRANTVLCQSRVGRCESSGRASLAKTQRNNFGSVGRNVAVRQ